MYIREDLVFDKHQCRLVGFVNMTEFGNQMQHLEELRSDLVSCPANRISLCARYTCFSLFLQKQPPVANRVLVFMVRGIFSSLNFPLAHFPTKGAKAIDLFDLLWQGVEFLEMNDFKVMFLTSECL